jgi:hypothetical protein
LLYEKAILPSRVLFSEEKGVRFSTIPIESLKIVQKDTIENVAGSWTILESESYCPRRLVPTLAVFNI